MATNTFPVTVNYDIRVEDAIKAGRYNWTNVASENFPSKRKGTAEMEIILIHFNREIGSDEAIREFDKQGLRPVELLELLAFGAKYPDVQREFSVVALGSVCRIRVAAAPARASAGLAPGVTWVSTGLVTGGVAVAVSRLKFETLNLKGGDVYG